MNETPTPLINLRAVRELLISGREIAIGKQFAADTKATGELIFNGSAELASAQEVPPTGILSAVTDRVSEGYRIGPPVDEESFVGLIEERCLNDGRLRATYEGQRIHWISQRDIADRVLERFDWPEQGFAELCRQLIAVRNANSAATKPIGLQSDISDEERVSRGYIKAKTPRYDELRDPFFSREEFQERRFYWYRRVGTDWEPFHSTLSGVLHTVDTLVETHLRSGRILCVQEKTYGCELIAPWNWVDRVPRPTRATTLHFLLTGELHQHWFSGKEALPLARHRATKFLLWAEPWAAEHGKQLVKRDALAIIQEVFGLTQNAADEVWSNVGGKIRRRTYNPKKEMQLTPSDIKELGIRAGEF